QKWNEEEIDTDDEKPLNPAADPEIAVGSYAQHYLAQHDPEQAAASPWRPKTFRSAKDALEGHVLPCVVGPGATTIGQRKARQWHRRWLPLLAEAKRAAGYARDSVRVMIQAASQLLDRAVDDELLRHHPLDRAARARIRKALKPTAAEKADAQTVRCFDPYLR